MINIKNKCTECEHHATCKYSEDYIKFGNRLSDDVNDLMAFEYEVIAEGITQLELTCKYFKPIASTPRSSFDL